MADRSIVVRLRAEIGNFRSDMQAAASAATATGTATAAAGRTVVGAMTQAQAAAQTTRQALFDAGKAAQESARGFGLSYNASGRLADEFGNVVTAAHAAEMGLDTVSEATQEYAAQTAHAAAETAAAATAAATASESGMTRMMNHARAHEEAWNKAGNSLALFGGAVVAGVGLAIHKFAEFDQAMSEVKASTHESAANMDLLREAAISAGADTAFSAKEAAQGIDELAKAGVSTKDILAGGLTGALSLAAAGSLGVGDAAEIAATALTQFKLAGKDIPHVADLLAAGAGKAQGSVQDMGMALKQSGLVASQVGLSIEETTGGLAAFASAGLVGSDAGTSFKSMLQRLTPQSKEAQKQMDALGISAYDSQGEFIGLSAFAGQLQNSMKGLDSESRNAAMGVIFGSDAVRAANVIYEQGSTGVQGWIDAVNETGFAAQTAAIKQDNLAGDIEKLGGSFDTVLIKGGEGAAQSLRGIVQQAEKMVDLFGKIPAPILNTGMAMAATVGGVALLAGGFLKMVPAVASTITNFRGVFREGSRIPGVMGKIGKGVGIATAALLAFEVFNAVAYQKRIVGLEEMTSALLKVANAADGSAAGLDSVFNDFGDFAGKKIAPDISSVADAIQRITNPESGDGINRWADETFSWTGFAKSETSQVDDQLKKVGESMGALASNGGADAAAKSFNALAAEFEKNGSTAQDALDHLPGYTEALRGIGNAAGLSLEPFELLQLAAGKIPDRLAQVQASAESSAAATEEAAKTTQALSEGLDEIGVSANGAISNLDTFTQSLVAAGLLTLSSRDAARAYEDTLDSFNETLAKNGKTLDQHTKAGRDNEAAIDAITKAGIANAESIAKDTAAYGSNTEAQAAVQAALKNTYTDMVNAYVAMGKGRTEADALTRATLHIPSNVNIDTWMADTARQKAQETKNAIDAIPKNTTVRVNYENTTTNRVNTINSESHIAEGPGGRGGITRAEGGPVYGPGTGTSDDVPAWLSNGEHVWTAAEVAKVGGQSAMYRMRAAAMAGELPAFAKGGTVAGFATGGHAGESANARANRLYRESKARAAAAKKAAAARQKELAKAAAYRSEQASDLSLDNSRGDGYGSVRESLSSAYSYSDKLRSVANSGNLPSQKSMLLNTANSSDAAMRRLYAQSTKLGKSLETAKKRMDDLQQVKSGVSSSLSGEFDLASAVTKSARYNGVANVAGIQKEATAKLNAIRSFGTKLNKLALKGYSGAIVQEIAAMGSGPGSSAADALLAGSSGDVKKLNTTYTDITKASDAAGTYVTNAMFKGGVNVAAGLVKGLESQQGAIEKQMLKIGLGMEKALKKALGIRSPSRKAMAIGDNFSGTLASSLLAGKGGVESAAKELGDAVYVVPSKSMAAGYTANVSHAVVGGVGAGGYDTAALDRLTEAVKSARPITVQQLSTNRATAMSVAREMEGV